MVSDDRSIERLAALLPDFLKSQRWFRAKTRTVERVEIEDVLPISGGSFYILIVRVVYAESDPDRYVLTTRGDGDASEVPEALWNEEFRASLLEAIACNANIPGPKGELIASRTGALGYECGGSGPRIDSFLSKAEQSNTSIIYKDRFILKLFRKIEPGINPDLEIGAFLTAHGFEHTPAVLGKLEYRSRESQDVYAAGILQQFVRNEGDAWKYTLGALNEFFDRALRGGAAAPVLKSYHPLDLLDEDMPETAPAGLGAYADSAQLLGRRTAEMHRALADSSDPDFAPERFTREDGEKLYEEMLGQADISFELLRRKQSVLPEAAAESARKLLKIEHRVMERFSAIRSRPIDAVRIRYHGDFHLGQVLYTGDDFMIIDFEGEPARPLPERRGKTLAMRDMAGMIRSFQYAAYTALSEQTSERKSSAEPWAVFWNTCVSATYLKAYFSAAERLPFVPMDAEERRLVFDAFLLQKALYEVAYELNNRPDWIHIPLRGILSLMS